LRLATAHEPAARACRREPIGEVRAAAPATAPSAARRGGRGAVVSGVPGTVPGAVPGSVPGTVPGPTAPATPPGRFRHGFVARSLQLAGGSGAVPEADSGAVLE